MPRPVTPAPIRFVRLVDMLGDNECWPWLGARSGGRYGNFRMPSRAVAAHRFAYELWKGPILDGNVIMHACDNTICMNPTHLSQGTMADNMHDRDNKGRNKAGPNRPSLKG